MTLISIASSIAIVLGFAGTLPHIVTMLKTRSSGGQAPLGWMFGITVNVMTGYVNLVGLGATMLGVGNVIAGAFNVVALALVLRFGIGEAAVATESAEDDTTPRGYFHELPTGEFDSIKSLIDEEHARRESFRIDGHELHDVRELVAA
jgi:hypothetical protein